MSQAPPGPRMGWRDAFARGRAFLPKALVTRPDPLAPDRLEAALGAEHGRAVALALLAFVVGFSVDDLRVFRFPGWLLGGALALLLLAFGPLVLARRLARRFAADDDRAFAARAGRRRRFGALLVLVASLATVAWLVLFSSGVPPWAR